MVAQGWVLATDKNANTITIGDGNHVVQLFEETYTLSPDCKIYFVDNSTTDGTVTMHDGGLGTSGKYTYQGTWNKVKDATFNDIKVCDRIDGEIYYVSERYTALCIFDNNYKSSWKDGTAKVSELYLFENALVMEKSDLSKPDGMQYDGTSWYQGANINDERVWYGFNGASSATEYMAGRLYDVGDTYTNVMMFVSDDGTITLLDMGNNIDSYQYPLKVAAVGYYPRDVDNIFLTHGHGDHNGAFYEFCVMYRCAGNEVNAMANAYAERWLPRYFRC